MNTRAQLIQAGIIKPAAPAPRNQCAKAAIESRRREAVCLTKAERALNVLRAAVAAAGSRA